MSKAFFASSLCLLMATCGTIAPAQQQCGPSEAVRAALGSTYGEVNIFAGRTQNTVVEVWVNQESGTWTISISTPDGATCLVAAGQEGMIVPVPDIKEGDPA